MSLPCWSTTFLCSDVRCEAKDTLVARGFRNLDVQGSANCSRSRLPAHMIQSLSSNQFCSFSNCSTSRLVLVRAQESEAGESSNGADERQAFAGFNGGRVKRALEKGAGRHWTKLCLDLKKETGIDIENVQRACIAFIQSFWQKAHSSAEEHATEAVSFASMLRRQLWPKFVAWNRWELWKDVKGWDFQRIGVSFIYLLLVASSFRVLNAASNRRHLIHPSTDRLVDAYMEAVVPEPTPRNVRKLRKALWRKNMPEGFRAIKLKKTPDGEYEHDMSFIGEDPWDNSDDERSQIEELLEKDTNKILDEDATLSEDERETLRVLAAASVKYLKKYKEQMDEDVPPIENKTWQERLVEWEKVLEKEEFNDRIDSLDSQFIVPFDWNEIKKNFLDERRKGQKSVYPRGYLLARKWWKYRPRLPYTYFLSKVKNLEVLAAVYTEDLKKLIVTMKEGFPSEYVVDIPVDPYLYQLMKKSGVQLDIMRRSSWYYYLRAFAVLAPSLLIISVIRLFHRRAHEFSSEKIMDLLKMNREHLILPEDAASKANTEYKDVVMGGDVWKVLEEIMTYMRNPMKYHSRRVTLPRGILISGPPGTGKTLLARAIARECGLPFIFASGAEFVESGAASGAKKVFDIFFTARANAPSFIFIDEVDALAGKNARDDPERRSTFEQLLAELDGEAEETDVDRYSLRQAVVMICATNRADELDDMLMRPGRIDREIYVGLPGEKERIGIFEVHSAGRPLANDADFSKLVYRTVGFSGADIRNLINEAGIMAIRRGHQEIYQKDFVDVLDKQLFEGMGLTLTEEEQQEAEERIPLEYRRLMAVHEAGHVLLAHLLPGFDWHAFTHLLPAGKDTALSVYYPREEMLLKGCTTVGYVKMQMVVAHGGRCAERIVFGEVTDGGQDDLERISKMAREIVIGPSSPRLGLFPMIWKDKIEAPKPLDQTDLVPDNWNKTGTRVANMTMELSELFTREVNRYIDETETEASNALEKNRHILDRLANELLHRVAISGVEISELIKSMNPIIIKDYLKLPDVKSQSMEISPSTGRIMRYDDELVIYPAPLHRC